MFPVFSTKRFWSFQAKINILNRRSLWLQADTHFVLLNLLRDESYMKEYLIYLKQAWPRALNADNRN